MIVQRAGGFGFKLSSGNTTVALNLPSGKSKLKGTKFGADVVLVSLPHEDWNGVDQASHGEKEPFQIHGPGAYEVGDVVISGYATPSTYGKIKSDIGNTVYVIEMDGIRVLALGALASPKLPPEVREELDDIGIVLVPVGGETLTPKDAHELVTSIEPNAIIPYEVGTEANMKAFLKAEGGSNKPEEKFTVRVKELATMDGDVVLLA